MTRGVGLGPEVGLSAGVEEGGRGSPDLDCGVEDGDRDFSPSRDIARRSAGCSLICPGRASQSSSTWSRLAGVARVVDFPDAADSLATRCSWP